MNENNVVAIDFGTSRTKLAYFNPKTKEVKLMYHGVAKFLPSYFAIDKDGKILLGYDAQKRVESEDHKVISNIKGRISELSLSIKSTPLRRIGKNPQELLTALFTYLKREARKQLPAFGTEPQRAYLTHPTTFSEDDKEILKNAAQDAGFSVKLIEEPVAAAEFVGMLGMDLPIDIIILDCGAGTLHWAYMVREYRYGDKPKHIIKRNIEPGGTITGTPDGENNTKRVIGGSQVEWGLARILKQRVGRITEDDLELLHHELKIRKEQFCRNPNDELPPIKIRDFSVPVNGREMKAAIEANYITPACNEVAPYIKKVIDATAKEGRKPTLLLTGGCAQIKDFADALKEKFGLDCTVIPEFEYATVQGALLLHVSERIETPEIKRIKTPESEEVVPHATAMLNKSIKENFNKVGNEIGVTLAKKAMSLLIKLADNEITNHTAGLDIGGSNDNYLWSVFDGNSYIGWEHKSILQNIISYFVKRISPELKLDVNDFTKNLYEEALLESIPSPKPILLICEDCEKPVLKAVENILDTILTDINIRRKIKDTVTSAQSLRRCTFPITIAAQNPIFRNMRAKSRRYTAKASICTELKEQLEQSRDTQEGHIQHAVVEVFRSTAEELCQQLIESARIKSTSTS